VASELPAAPTLVDERRAPRVDWSIVVVASLSVDPPPEPTGCPLMYTCTLEVVVTAVVVESASVDAAVVVAVDGLVVVVVGGGAACAVVTAVVEVGAVVVAVDGLVVVVGDEVVAWAVVTAVVETGGATTVVVVVVVVTPGEDGIDGTVATGGGVVGAELAAGMRAAAAVRFSSPTVMPVTGSWTGVADCWIQLLIWSTVGREPNRDS
jgi:hypothetical protein